MEGELTLAQLALGLPLRLANELRAACVPLAASATATIETRQLDVFWEEAERHVSGLSSKLDMPRMTRLHLQHLAPIILGPAAWHVVKE